MKFEKSSISSTVLKGRFEEHKEVKKKLLDLQKDAPGEPCVLLDDYHTDNISFTDWFHAGDLENRPWVKYFMPRFTPYWGEMAKELGFENLQINKLWFQRYNQESFHNWHTHASNYTGVYYLELPEGSGQTEFIDPTDLRTTWFNDAKEGDIIFFPCHLIHRGSIQQINKQKTIISWNLDFQTIRRDVLKVGATSSTK
jgi:hypothetical protein